MAAPGAAGIRRVADVGRRHAFEQAALAAQRGVDRLGGRRRLLFFADELPAIKERSFGPAEAAAIADSASG